MALFPMPTDSDFVLTQGLMAQNTRRRRKSDACLPSSMSTHLPQQQSDGSAVERRRNTLGHVRRPAVISFLTSAFSYKQQRPVSPPLSSCSSLTQVEEAEEMQTSPCRSHPAAHTLHKQAEGSCFATLLTPPHSPSRPTTYQRCQSDHVLQPPVFSLNSITEIGDTDSEAENLFVPEQHADDLCDTEDDGVLFNYAVLGSKKIRLERPRLINL
ncbi:hypothetical protein GQ54DRAFT_1196 [Martensiomyces pterosporus]|nr:hypothetical protein GQ54DRAFT_1196 [Martensiomyces pterosporus]